MASKVNAGSYNGHQLSMDCPCKPRRSGGVIVHKPFQWKAE